MRKTILAVAALAALPLSACVTPTPAGPVGVAFDPGAFNWSTAPGRGRIEGQLVYRRGGVSYSCQAAGVVLTPETPWVRNRMMTLYRSASSAAVPAADVRARLPAESPNYDAYVRRAACDAQGNFTFTGLPDGSYFVITSALPQPEGPPVAIMRRVSVRNGMAVRIEL
jgi:hypothetical protein